MHVGVDFDNTIVCCDPLFHRAAVEKKLVPSDVGEAKSEVRNYLRRIGKEPAWTELQGYVYGHLLRDAQPFPGVLEFFSRCVKTRVPVSIISHKTKKPFLGEPYDLHKAAGDWLKTQGFFDQAGLSPDSVYFELTKEAKLARIAAAHCTHFIDDLPEFLSEPGFPAGVERILFDPSSRADCPAGVSRVGSWAGMQDLLWNR